MENKMRECDSVSVIGQRGKTHCTSGHKREEKRTHLQMGRRKADALVLLVNFSVVLVSVLKNLVHFQVTLVFLLSQP